MPTALCLAHTCKIVVCACKSLGSVDGPSETFGSGDGTLRGLSSEFGIIPALQSRCLRLRLAFEDATRLKRSTLNFTSLEAHLEANLRQGCKLREAMLKLVYHEAVRELREGHDRERSGKVTLEGRMGEAVHT